MAVNKGEMRKEERRGRRGCPYVLRRWCAGGVMPFTSKFLVAVTNTAAPEATVWVAEKRKEEEEGG
jgi:hypothetical protein